MLGLKTGVSSIGTQHLSTYFNWNCYVFILPSFMQYMHPPSSNQHRLILIHSPMLQSMWMLIKVSLNGTLPQAVQCMQWSMRTLALRTTRHYGAVTLHMLLCHKTRTCRPIDRSRRHSANLSNSKQHTCFLVSPASSDTINLSVPTERSKRIDEWHLEATIYVKWFLKHTGTCKHTHTCMRMHIHTYTQIHTYP